MRSKIHTKALVIFHHLMRLMVVFAFAQFLYWGRWIDAACAGLVFILMIMPAVMKDKYKIYFPFVIEITVVTFIFISIFLGSLQGFYQKYAWWDGVLHFLSGLIFAVVGFILVYILNERKSKRITMSPFFVSLFSVSFTLALSVVWEIYEYAMDVFFGYQMQEDGLPDTMSDLIVCTVGALIVGVISYVWMKHRSKVPFTPKQLATD